jgi:hypothetical protein
MQWYLMIVKVPIDMLQLIKSISKFHQYPTIRHLSGQYADTVGEGEDGLRPSQYAFLDRLMKEANRNYVYSLAKAEEYKRQAMQGTLQIHKLEDARAVPPRGFQRVPALVVPGESKVHSRSHKIVLFFLSSQVLCHVGGD